MKQGTLNMEITIKMLIEKHVRIFTACAYSRHQMNFIFISYGKYFVLVFGVIFSWFQLINFEITNLVVN